MANKRTPLSTHEKTGISLNTPMDTSAPILEQYWPEGFAPVRLSLFLVAASAVLAAMMFSAASLGAFTAVKISLAEWLGLTRPDMVSAANFDVATVVWAMGTALFLGIIHPCLGIGLLLLLRPWLDGYTFFSDNVYFTWSIYGLCALWLIRLLKQGKRLQTPPPALLLAAMLCVFFVGSRFTYQYYNTYQHLWLWVGYVSLFFLVISAVRSRAVWGIVFTIFLFGVGLQAFFSVLHFEYLLPHLRRAIQDPAMLQRYFGTTDINPELARRFNVNRAFGSMLFPNALAAYLLLGIPFAVVAVKMWWVDARNTLRRKEVAYSQETTTTTDRIVLLTIAVVFGIGCFVAIFFFAHFPQEYVYKDSVLETPVYLRTAPLTLFAFVGACCVSLSLLLILTRYGIEGFWHLLRFAGVCLLAPLLLYTLWITYSRGAYLALLFTSLWSAVLLITSRAQAQWIAARIINKKNLTQALLALLFLAALCAVLVDMEDASSYAQPADPRTQVQPEGITLTASELADPASLRLRFGYWRVALRMALDNLVAGVGLGNFAVAYPAYQYIGAGDVREAHNGFLQVFAETGLFGGLLFLAFWLYFGLWGAWRIINEKNSKEKLLLLGLYAGIVAFCMHAFVDIDFSHASLVMFVMVCTGLFYARAALSDAKEQTENLEQPAHASKHRIVSTVLLVALVISAAAVFRVYAQQLALSRFNFINVSYDGELSKRMRTGQFFIAETTQFGNAINDGVEKPKNPRILIALAQLFLDSYEEVADASVFYKPAPDQRNRFLRLQPEEPIPADGLMVVARKPFYVRRCAMDNIAAWIEELKQLDSWFPHHHELALNIVKWYEMLIDYVYGSYFVEKRPIWISEYLRWNDILAQRNPHHADVRMFHAQALLKVALLHQDEQSEDLMKQAVQEWDAVLTLTPISHGHRYACAAALMTIGDYYNKSGDTERANNFRKRAEQLRGEAAKIQKEREQSHLYQ